MSIYDLVYEEDHSELYNLLLNPINVVEPLQNVLTTGFYYTKNFNDFSFKKINC